MAEEAVTEAVLWGLAVGGSLFAGAVIAAGIRLPQGLAAGLTAFGGGVLLAAVSFELVPDADERAGVWTTAGCLLGGTLVYIAADALLSRDEGTRRIRRLIHAAAAGRPMETEVEREAARGEAIAVGLFVDGVPESLALGLTLAEGELAVPLLVGIVVGNVTEAYGATQPIAHGRSKKFAVGLLAGIGLFLAAATVLGSAVEVGDHLIGASEAVASGAIIGVLSISVVPYAFDEVNRLVAAALALGLVLGYVLG